jgi:hypothetical protein
MMFRRETEPKENKPVTDSERTDQQPRSGTALTWSKDPLISFGTSEQVAYFLLHEAFEYANEAAAYEVAGELFAERIESIDPQPGWQMPAMPETLNEWLAQRNAVEDNILDPVTLNRLTQAWHTSQQDARPFGRKISKTKRLQSITDVVGHVLNLGTCIETVINRHLFHLREIGRLSPDHYRMLDRTEVLPKILFSFKDEISQGTLHLSNLKYLVSLRNKAVHFKTSPLVALEPTCEQLLGVWKDAAALFGLVEGEPTPSDADQLITDFAARWLMA